MHVLSAAVLRLLCVFVLHEAGLRMTSVNALRTIAPSEVAPISTARLPVNAALFLPRVFVPGSDYEDEPQTVQYHLATIDNVLPVMDVAISDAQKLYLPRWIHPQPWLRLRPTAIGSCEDQKTIAWAVQEAIHWTNGSGVRSAPSLLSLCYRFSASWTI